MTLLCCTWRTILNMIRILVRSAWMALTRCPHQVTIASQPDGARRFLKVKEKKINLLSVMLMNLFLVHLGNALMQHTPVSVLPQDDCQSKLQSSNLGYRDSLICGVTQQDACQVDVGSALACVDLSGRYTLKGVYSTESGCNVSNQVVAYTRTDLQWVRTILQNPARAAFNY